MSKGNKICLLELFAMRLQACTLFTAALDNLFNGLGITTSFSEGL